MITVGHALGWLSLDTPQKRLSIWFGLSVLVFIAPYQLLENLSLYKWIGLSQAPSIGLTRAYHHLLHGRVDQALEMNPLILVVIVIGVPLLLADSLKVLRRA